MKKRLADMTPEELWRRFPICLTAHQHGWEDWYREERALLERLLPMEKIIRISWIGSTAVKDIWAKPIVDILVETDHVCGWEELGSKLLDCGYLRMSEKEGRMSFNKGYTENGFADRVFHLHLRRTGDHDELFFRDYLMEHPETARDYERMKLKLWKRFEFQRDAYTAEKTAFVQLYTEKAKRLYAGRYVEVKR